MNNAINLVQFPERDMGNVPRQLRALADGVEQGEYGDAHNVAWVVDCGNSHIEIGLAGKAPEAGITAHYLFALAMRKLEVVV